MTMTMTQSAPPEAKPQTAGRVVVGVDDSDASREALRWAADVARWRNWTLHIVHTWHMSYPVTPYAPDLGAIETAVMRGAEEICRDIEAEVLGEAEDIDVRETVAEGSAAHVLVAASNGADLLVVGSRGRGGIASLALGSVGQACVHHAHCPVLVVRPQRPKPR
jgi:nucleotide-binding universal stress UspA family protein